MELTGNLGGDERVFDVPLTCKFGNSRQQVQQIDSAAWRDCHATDWYQLPRQTVSSCTYKSLLDPAGPFWHTCSQEQRCCLRRATIGNPLQSALPTLEILKARMPRPYQRSRTTREGPEGATRAWTTVRCGTPVSVLGGLGPRKVMDPASVIRDRRSLLL
jgi:hypothetical protein